MTDYTQKQRQALQRRLIADRHMTQVQRDAAHSLEHAAALLRRGNSARAIGIARLAVDALERQRARDAAARRS